MLDPKILFQITLDHHWKDRIKRNLILEEERTLPKWVEKEGKQYNQEKYKKPIKYD